jgi:hypothetical protein
VARRYLLDVQPIWVFVTGAAAIGGLADWVGRATEQLAHRAGATIGGLLNVSFGNIAELVLALFVLSEAETQVCRRRSPDCYSLGFPHWSAASAGRGKRLACDVRWRTRQK